MTRAAVWEDPASRPTKPTNAMPSRARGPDPANTRAREDRALFERYLDRRDPADRELIVERFLPLARHLARRYQSAHEPFDDLFQVACLGLVKAIDRYDLKRDVAFSSYAVPTIAGEIKRHYRDRTWSVRVPRDLQELSLNVERTRLELSLALGRQPTVAEIATDVNADAEEVVEALEAFSAYRANSLEAQRGDDDHDNTLGDTLGVREAGFARAEQRAMLKQLMRILTSRERIVLHLRFAHDLTQIEIGERMGVSQMQVSRILRQALARLRSHAPTERELM